ncbi:hypothetical protein N7326_08435 [Corynebacterium sp. ES2794-CONJ1]|uniref:hypothetical protein n=1 Tax=unclassified Corynebacterium TaxID=2624378 RepID=UPI0021673A85|nr:MULTISPECIES: hypothetical protein [unclassified Corynebacterium]MCS4490535.1 hypothetical protein [Corynebacterium sp. ES2775-CONJ]MCS4492314.1 hypothetical protein [Corynebacterium sp. ES2715-CONJ3]MCS4532494.1 hypothetical protein [Corynebacterium sp. ES2730-CONJ]MCU9519889.1 hypothetical protein [Corynebacterium sp. ES2794-CONJ1]
MNTDIPLTGRFPVLIRNFGSGRSTELTRMGLRVLLEHEKIGSPPYEWGIYSLYGPIQKFGSTFDRTAQSMRAALAKQYHGLSAKDIEFEYFADCCVQSAGADPSKVSLWLRFLWDPHIMSEQREILKNAKRKLITHLRHNPETFAQTNLSGFDRCVLVLPRRLPFNRLSDYFALMGGSYIYLLEDFASGQTPDLFNPTYVPAAEELSGEVGEYLDGQ